MEHLLDAKQVAAIMGIDWRKVHRLARAGVLPHIKVGCEYRFRESTLEAWIEDNEISERKSSQAGPVVGVQVSDIKWGDATEVFGGGTISFGRLREDCSPDPSVLPE